MKIEFTINKTITDYEAKEMDEFISFLAEKYSLDITREEKIFYNIYRLDSTWKMHQEIIELIEGKAKTRPYISLII